MGAAGAWVSAVVICGALVPGCGRRDAPPPPPREPAGDAAAPAVPFTKTPNEFLTEGAPTFVVGTRGDDAEDRITRAQARMIQALFFPSASIVEDETIFARKGPSAWPSRPVVYGGVSTAAPLAELAPTLPFQLDKARLVLSDQTFEGDDLQLVTVLPARAADDRGVGHPEMLLYLGAGPGGVAEINARGQGSDNILVADRFGRLATGRWVVRGAVVVAELGPRAARPKWRTTERAFHGTVVRFFAEEGDAAKDEPYVAACLRGLDRAVERLSLESASPLDVYLYPDRAAKAAVTGVMGDGHAVPSGRALHVVRYDPAPNGGLEGLVAHEATHVYATLAWGGPGTPAMGEGLAVWVSGRYQGVPLADLRKRFGAPPKTAELLSKKFFSLGEPVAYPASAQLVDAAIQQVGLSKLRQHLYAATSLTWADACDRAGFSPPP